VFPHDIEWSELTGANLGRGTSDRASLNSYIPGGGARFYEPNTGSLLRAGSTLTLEIHYTTSGKVTTDESELGIYFYPEGVVPTERLNGGIANSFAVHIPAGAKDHSVNAALTTWEDAYLQRIGGHMHYRGKSLKFTALFPDGRELLIASIPNYNFNWQRYYDFEEPLFIPAGTKLTTTGVYDNSAQNSANPDPTVEVGWGEQTWQEMLAGYFTWKLVDQNGSE